MRLADSLGFSFRALTAHRARTGLTLLAMGVGTAMVVLLSALGEGARLYVSTAFAELGSRLLIVLPGRSETVGGPPPLLGETPRDLTLEDALALRRLPWVEYLAPVVLGSAPVSRGSLEREATILGSTADFQAVRHLKLARGRFLPPGDPERGQPVVVLGQTLARELFGRHPLPGGWVRIGDRRFRVIGLLGDSGMSIGLDLGDLAIVPVASAQALFDSPGLFRLLIQVQERVSLEEAAARIRDRLRQRHEGEDDITLVTQDTLLSAFDKILYALTLGVSGIAAISLLVAGVLIMNVMLVAVAQRRAEIGLLKALGAARAQILALFLIEALLLAATGTAAGLLFAALVTLAFNAEVEAFQLVVPLWAPLAAAGVSLSAGLLFGLLPALRAARLDPVAALAGS